MKNNEGVTISEIEMYTDCSRAIVNTLIKNEYLERVEKKIERNPLKDKKIQKTDHLILTKEQQNAYEKVELSIKERQYKNFLLYGVTGSRKNRDIFAINTKSNKNGSDSYCISS